MWDWAVARSSLGGVLIAGCADGQTGAIGQALVASLVDAGGAQSGIRVVDTLGGTAGCDAVKMAAKALGTPEGKLQVVLVTE